MKTLLTAALATLCLVASSALASDIKLGNWNIQTLTYCGDPQTVFPDAYVRTVCQPFHVRRFCMEVAIDQVLGCPTDFSQI